MFFFNLTVAVWRYKLTKHYELRVAITLTGLKLAYWQRRSSGREKTATSSKAQNATVSAQEKFKVTPQESSNSYSLGQLAKKVQFNFTSLHAVKWR